MIELWDFQAEAVEGLRENIRHGVMNQILCAPTGSGKTEIAAYLLQECDAKGKRGVFVCDRVSLIDQTSARFDKYGIPHGVIQAQHWRWRPWSNIQVASAQTLARRTWPDADLIIIDEAHTLYGSVTKRIGRRDTVTIGLTATPFTRGLGRHYDAVVSVTTTHKLIEQGRLAPFRVFSASEPDMEGAKVVAGEWTDAEAEKRALPIVGDCVSEYLKHCAGKKFIAFGVNIRHCEELQRQFMAAGVLCGLYTAHTPDAERVQMLEDFATPDGHLTGLISVAALAKGFDAPTVECVIIARPLRKSLAEHIQIIGRGLRRDPTNPFKVCTILDHAGNMMRMWDETMEFFETGMVELDDGKPKPKTTREKKRPDPRKCPKCAHVHAPRPMCPACGFEYPRRSDVEHQEGTLSEVAGAAASADDKQALYSGLLWIARDRGYKPGWAAHKYKERTGVWPRGLHDVPSVPSPALKRWVTSRMIAYAKARAA